MVSLGPRDPSGHYIIVMDKRCYDMIKDYLAGIDVIDAGDEIIARTRSRSRGQKIIRIMRRYCR